MTDGTGQPHDGLAEPAVGGVGENHHLLECRLHRRQVSIAGMCQRPRNQRVAHVDVGAGAAGHSEARLLERIDRAPGRGIGDRETRVQVGGGQVGSRHGLERDDGVLRLAELRQRKPQRDVEVALADNRRSLAMKILSRVRLMDPRPVPAGPCKILLDHLRLAHLHRSAGPNRPSESLQRLARHVVGPLQALGQHRPAALQLADGRVSTAQQPHCLHLAEIAVRVSEDLLSGPSPLDSVCGPARPEPERPQQQVHHGLGEAFAPLVGNGMHRRRQLLGLVAIAGMEAQERQQPLRSRQADRVAQIAEPLDGGGDAIAGLVDQALLERQPCQILQAPGHTALVAQVPERAVGLVDVAIGTCIFARSKRGQPPQPQRLGRLTHLAQGAELVERVGQQLVGRRVLVAGQSNLAQHPQSMSRCKPVAVQRCQGSCQLGVGMGAVQLPQAQARSRPAQRHVNEARVGIAEHLDGAPVELRRGVVAVSGSGPLAGTAQPLDGHLGHAALE